MNNKCGFFEDENNLKLMKVFENNSEFKEIYIDIYSDNPFDKATSPILMLRRNENNVAICNDEKSIIIKTNDTYIAELILNNVNKCYYKKYIEDSFDFVLNCQNIFYKITIFK